VIILPGRVLMALFGAGTVWQTGLLGRDLFNRRVGLVAACVVAISPLCVYWGQVIRSDIMGSFFILLAMRAMLRGENRPGWRADAVVAFWLGVAIATKWPMGLAGLAMAGLVGRRILGKPETALPELFRLARCGVMSALFTLMASPYLLLAHETVLRNLQGEAQAHHLGATGGTPLENLGWYLRGPLADGLGWPGLVLAAIGLVLVVRHADRRAAWLLSPVLLAMGVVICLQHLVGPLGLAAAAPAGDSGRAGGEHAL
jgi:4-amino-4-deoxy-L-arabinose transferase-like glycosyltransferase